MTSVLKSVFCPPFLVRSFTLPSFWKLGGWGFHLNRQACASLVGDSLTERVKRERAREMERKERERMWEVSSMRPDDAILCRNMMSAPPMAAHAQPDAWRVSTATPSLPCYRPSSLSLAFYSPSPLLRNKCQMLNKHSGICSCSIWPPQWVNLSSFTHACTYAQTCSKGHIALLSSHTSVLFPFRASTFQSYQTCNNCH